MIYKTQDGVNVIQFGTGDICVTCIGDEFGDHLDSLGLFQIPNREIGEYLPEYDGKPAIKTHTRLYFTDPKSIDIVISHLQKIKESIVQEQQPKKDGE